MAKVKGFLSFQLKPNQKFNLFGEDFPSGDPNPVRVVSVLRDENGLPILTEYVEWDATGKTQGPRKLEIRGNRRRKR